MTSKIVPLVMSLSRWPKTGGRNFWLKALSHSPEKWGTKAFGEAHLLMQHQALLLHLSTLRVCNLANWEIRKSTWQLSSYLSDLEFLESEKSQRPATGFFPHLQNQWEQLPPGRSPTLFSKPRRIKSNLASIGLNKTNLQKKCKHFLSPKKRAGDVRLPISFLESKGFRDLSKTS